MIKFYKICRKYIVKGAAYPCIRTCKAFFSSIPFFSAFIHREQVRQSRLYPLTNQNRKYYRFRKIFPEIRKIFRIEKKKGLLLPKQSLVRETGLEPVRWIHTPLKRARLPVPPLSHSLSVGGIQALPLRRILLYGLWDKHRRGLGRGICGCLLDAYVCKI